METIDRKLLLWSSADPQLTRILARDFKNAGAAFINIESIATDVVPKLQDKSFEGCILYGDPTDFSTLSIIRLLEAIRKNRLTSLVPVIVITTEMGENVSQMYLAGANFITSSDKVEEACYVLNSLLQLLDRYKVGGLARFTR
jgi:hypothetical protein